jgi:2-polyprenyl-6-methoxyphenol hydroxylase-like FAD-dependent oxidoreductase
MTADVDVAIVGYGPIGQSLATLLGRRGWKVAVFDRQATLYPLPRACHLDHEAMRILQAMGIADDIDQAIVPAREYLLLRPDLTTISDLPRGWETPSGWEASYHFFQPDVESIFDDAARSLPGVSVHQGTEVVEIEERDENVLLRVRDAEGPSEITARYVVGADGANSIVRTQLGIGQEDLGFEATWVVVDVEIKEGFDLPRVPDTGQVLDPAQPRHMAWLGGRHYRWEFMIVDGADPAESAQADTIWPKLSAWVNPESAVLLRSAIYTFRSLVADTFNRGRLALAGDAAHLMPPFMGQGMVSGMRDAVTLSWMLDLVLRDAAPTAFLDEYTSSRRAHVTDYIAESVRVGQLVCETDPVKAAERDRILEAQTEAAPPFQPPITGFILPGPLSGYLSVQPRIADRDGALLDDVLGHGFAILAIDEADLEGLTAEVRGVIDSIGAQVALIRTVDSESHSFTGGRVLTEEGSRFTSWLKDAGASWVIVRPDGYVFGASAGSAELTRALVSLGKSLSHAVTV